MVLLIRRNDRGIDNISNKLIIKGFPVGVVIFSEMGPLLARCHLVDRELFGGKLMGLVLSGAAPGDRIGGSRWCAPGL